MSGIGEAALVLGLASSAITILDSIKKVYDSASDASGLPRPIRAVGIQLPLALDTLRSVTTAFEANQSDATTTLVDPVFGLCRTNGTKLKAILDKVVSVEGASRAERLKKALHTPGKTKKVEDLMKEIFESLLLLQSNHIFRSAIDAAKLEAAQVELSRIEDGGSGSFNNYGDGPMNNNTGTGPQHNIQGPGRQTNYTSSGSGHQYIGGSHQSASS